MPLAFAYPCAVIGIWVPVFLLLLLLLAYLADGTRGARRSLPLSGRVDATG